MKLQDLMRGLPYIDSHSDRTKPSGPSRMSSIDPEIQAIHFDSREVQSGTLFVAIEGTRLDGHDFLAEVISKGACGLVVTQNFVKREPKFNFKDVPVFVVEDSRRALDFLANRFYGNPSQGLYCVGVTGTNGKTSLTYLIEYLFNTLGKPTGVIGTIDHHLVPRGELQKKIWAPDGTTPNPMILQKRLSEFLNLGAQALVMEVTSHALEQRRVESLAFDMGVFLNLTQDHLDYHGTMEKYFQSKLRFFTDLLRKSSKKDPGAVINISDPWGLRVYEEFSGRKLSFGSESADFSYKIQAMSGYETRFTLNTPMGNFQVRSPLCGEHNVQNVVASLGSVCLADLDLAEAIKALPGFPGIPGRLQLISNPQKRPIFVDYAHTPDGLEKLLRALHSVRTQSPDPSVRIWTVFGCGGDRDRGKRRQMAQVAERLSDEVMVTSDNPRTEDPELIIDEIVSGFTPEVQYTREVDRRKAIEQVLTRSESKDLVVVAGKGHEDYQIIGNQKIHFSDLEVIENYFKEV